MTSLNIKKISSILLLFIVTMSFSQNRKEISREWTSFVQTISVASKAKNKFKIEASVKLVTTDKFAKAAIWARVDNKNDEVGFFDNMADRPIKSDEWQTYTIEGTIDSDSKLLNFGGLCQFNGQFYFDNFKLYIENEKGNFELVKIFNHSFEEPFSNATIPKWNLGITEKKAVIVKEYKTSTSEDKVEGKTSLLIEGKGIKSKDSGKITPIEGASPQMGVLIAMLEDLKGRVENQVKNMSQYEIDFLHDDKANRIGALIMHLAAAEKYYQVLTFENREFNQEEKDKWEVALNLDQDGRDFIKGHDIQYYLDIFNEVRAKTIAELKKRDDAWLQEVQKKYDYNNFYCWFHVMEHQSSHLGQILFLQKRIPPENKLKNELPQIIKN